MLCPSRIRDACLSAGNRSLQLVCITHRHCSRLHHSSALLSFASRVCIALCVTLLLYCRKSSWYFLPKQPCRTTPCYELNKKKKPVLSHVPSGFWYAPAVMSASDIHPPTPRHLPHKVHPSSTPRHLPMLAASSQPVPNTHTTTASAAAPRPAPPRTPRRPPRPCNSPGPRASAASRR